MKKENRQILGIILICVAVIFIIFLRVKPKNDVELCRDIFLGFVNGNRSMQNYIDWEHLKALGVDVGETYSKLGGMSQKEDYRREFYRNFSKSFKDKGGSFDAFTGWRVLEYNGATTVVAVDYKAKSSTALFTLSGFEKKKLTDIKWEAGK